MVGRERGKGMKSPAEIANENDWEPGALIREREEGRRDRVYEVTAVGRTIVLGCRILKDGTLGKETELPLDDELIEWVEVKRAGDGYIEREDMKRDIYKATR